MYAQQGYALGTLEVFKFSVKTPNSQFLCHIYTYIDTQTDVGLLRSMSCTGRAIHAFSNKMRRSALKDFLLRFNGTPHPLGSTIARAAVVPVVCFSECFSSCARTATPAVIHVCSSISGSELLRLGSPCSAE